tara:strand:+ start:832 stop:1260 length:429 start_codon:yes stop_codon:yes gene_type:complete
MTRYNMHNNRRALRVGEAMRHVLSDLLTTDTNLDHSLGRISITVSEVRVTPDLRHAFAYVLPLGGKTTEAVIEALTRSAPKWRGPVARALNLKYAPLIEFRIDQSFNNAEKIDTALQEYDSRSSLSTTTQTSNNEHTSTSRD